MQECECYIKNAPSREPFHTRNDMLIFITLGKENEIRTELTLNDQEKLGIADSLWLKIIHTPGWFPIATEI